MSREFICARMRYLCRVSCEQNIIVYCWVFCIRQLANSVLIAFSLFFFFINSIEIRICIDGASVYYSVITNHKVKHLIFSIIINQIWNYHLSTQLDLSFKNQLPRCNKLNRTGNQTRTFVWSEAVKISIPSIDFHIMRYSVFRWVFCNPCNGMLRKLFSLTITKKEISFEKEN